ncbi:MAG: efflux RND transporter periplasmic adaptor subunit [Candidatus Moranbacteria bacterium]|nr:efflux RND transporter periplasmic adaptor subunit [Candidatus Moranbacteria bacterium]
MRVEKNDRKNREQEFFPKQIQDNKPKDSKRLVFFIAGVIGAIALIVFLSIEKQEQKPKSEVKKNISVVEVGQAETTNAIINKTIKVHSQDEAVVIAQHTGRIVEVDFEVGQAVKKGEILAKFDQSALENSATIELNHAGESVEIAHDSLEATEESAEKSYKSAKNEVEVAKINLERIKENGDDKDIDEAEERLEQAERNRDNAEAQGEARVEQAKSTLNQAEKGYKQALISQRNTIIRAPVDGIVTSKNLFNNQYLSSGAIIAKISTSNNLESTIYLSQDEAGALKSGDIIDVYCEGKQGYANLAKVKSVASIPDSSNLRYAVAIEYFKTMGESKCLSANRFVEAQFKLPVESLAGNFFLPISAVKVGQTKNTVFVIQDQIAQVREVKTGKVFGEYIEITQGLDQGELVALQGSKSLSHGDKVKIQNQ